ncbi:nuclear transport factor 2 family protein [Kutzneria sp. NPDC051319]|uniref:nuclear transport factor 2 family protein n=1 Tax=Kutzneria sp. NPDC051319 TaxID=3155047 RepID=UPI003442AE38
MHNPGPLELEHACWDAIVAGAAVELLDGLMTDEAVLLLADNALRRKEVLEYYASPAPWRACRLEAPRVVELTDAAAVVIYTAVLLRNDSIVPERLACTSVYVLDGGTWRRSFHEQGAL